MNKTLISKIFAKIKKTPADITAYEDMFSLCRNMESENFKLAHETNEKLRKSVSQAIKNRENVEGFFELYNSLYGESAATSVKTLGASVLNSANELTVDVTSPTLGLNWTVYDASYTHSLAIRQGSTTIVTITGLSGSTGTNNKTVTLTTAQRTSILNAMSAVQSLSVTYVLTTYSGSTQIGSTSSVSGTIKTTSATSAPTFTAFTFLDNNSTTVGVTGNNQLCVQSYSSLRVTCTAATAKNGASISKYRATIGTKTVESTSTTISFGAITDSGNLTLTITAIDSRGYTKSVSKSITVIAYERIVINSWNIRRVNNVEETIQLSFNGSLSPVLVNNIAKNSFVRARYRYKRTTATSYNAYATIGNVNSDSSGFSFEDDAFIELPAAYPYLSASNSYGVCFGFCI